MQGLRRVSATTGGAALIVAVLASLWLAVPAAAEPPAELSGDVTDLADVLDAGEEAAVQAALDDLAAGNEVQLFVVYVNTFDGDGQSWADTTAENNGLGTEDALFAVAVGDSQYRWSVASEFPVSDEQIAAIVSDSVEPLLRADDFAGAAVAFAEGLADADSASGEGADSSGFSIGGLLMGLVIATVVIVVVSKLVSRRGKGDGAGSSDASIGWAGEGGPERSMAALEAEANALLVHTDDAIKTSEQELGFAEAEFGTELTVPFQQALAQARTALTQAFRLRQQLDDDQPEDVATRTQLLTSIVTMCRQANDALDDQVEHFDQLRDMAQRLPQTLAALGTSIESLRKRLPQSALILGELNTRYPASALVTVKGNAEQATARVDFAAAQVTSAQSAHAAGDGGEAVAHVRAAEDAVGQASLLLESVDRAADTLATANTRIADLLAETDRDIAEAQALASSSTASADSIDDSIDQAALGGLVDQARASADAARRTIASAGVAAGFDPLAVISDLNQADGALEASLVGVREAAAAAAKAHARVSEAIAAALGQIRATDDYITTRRGAIGTVARTRLAEAQRQCQRAQELLESDLNEAMTAATSAHQLAIQAAGLAERDVADASQARPSGNGNINGALLGGILLDSLLRGGFGGSGGSGGFGGGSFGGLGGGGGGRSPGSFGGMSTRGRRGGGGRF